MPRPGFLYPITYLTAYARQDQPDDDELVIPEVLTEVADEDLTALHEQAVEAFNALHERVVDGDASIDDLRDLADGISHIREERDRRAHEQAERAEQADAIAAEVNPAGDEPCEDCDQADQTDSADQTAPADGEVVEGEVVATVDAETGEVTEVGEPEQVAASASSGRKEIRLNLPSLRSRQQRTPRPVTQAETMRDIVVAAPDAAGYSTGDGMDYSDLAGAVDHRMRRFNLAAYQRAAARGEHMSEAYGIAAIQRPIPDDLMVTSSDVGETDSILQRAMDERRLPQGSLVASGGWCAPSETVYDLCELESRDGLISVPELGLTRGGLNFTMGPDFAELFANEGFCYTEEEMIAGDFDGQGGGSKPCFDIPCPEFEDHRLGVCGLCISVGLLQQRGYPELVARFIRGVLTAHEHQMASRVIAQIIAGSTAVNFPSPQAGATAPILTAIELQAEAVKYTHRMSRGTTLEAIFPFWVRGAIRADLSRRLGVDMMSVTDAQIQGWFTARGIAPQWIYNWQDLASTATSYPAQVQFLMYPAGTWVKGVQPVINLSNIYDSVQLGQNVFTALFVEDGMAMLKLCHDSRLITVPICPDGATAGGIGIECNGTVTVEPDEG